MTTQDLIDHLNRFIAPVTPFDTTDYSDPLAIDKLREQWFATVEKEDVCRSLAEIITAQKPSEWPDREWMYYLEICQTGGLLRHSEHAYHLMNKIIPLLSDKNKRTLVIQVLGELGVEESVSYLEKLPINELSEEQLTDLAATVGMIGGQHSRGFLNTLKDNIYAQSPVVQREIAIALENIDQ